MSLSLNSLPAADVFRMEDDSVMQGETLELSGYASRFDVMDLSGDQVRRGAFSASLLSQIRPLPMLYNHETETPIGVWDRAVEDETGLWVSGRLFTGSELSNRAARLIERGLLSGLSIGFRTRKFDPRLGGGRDLIEIELWEVSIVAFPMLPSARLTEIGTSGAGERNFTDDDFQPPQAEQMTRSL